jgi:AcrR family transcriptional regulator
MNTREKILNKTLEVFNERGIEYVGLRELATMLDMRVSNITYYFPTKDDLVYQLSLELSKKNAEIIIDRDELTMRSFLEMLHVVFNNHSQYRCLLLSFVHLMEQNKLIAEAYKNTQKVRNATLTSNLKALAASGYLQVVDEEEMAFLVTTLALISRFWISEARISFRQLNHKEQIRHSLSLIIKLLLPYSTEKAKKEIEHFLESL